MYGISAFNLGDTYGRRDFADSSHRLSNHQRPGAYYPVSLYDVRFGLLGDARPDTRTDYHGGIFRHRGICSITHQGEKA